MNAKAIGGLETVTAAESEVTRGLPSRCVPLIRHSCNTNTIILINTLLFRHPYTVLKTRKNFVTMPESAIPQHLRRERKCPMNMAPNHAPAYPSYCARFPPGMKTLVVSITGAQFPSPSGEDQEASKAISILKYFLGKAPEENRPAFWEVTSMVDKKGAFNIAVLAYWSSVEAHKNWETESGFAAWWQSPERETDGHGWFQEVFCPTLDRFETVFSNSQNPEGAANMQQEISDEILEHAYFGSMRDRLAAAQDDELKGGPRGDENGRAGGRTMDDKRSARMRVTGKTNLCVIRSGQDWSDTLPEERELYIKTMQPVLVEGMNFLRDEGREIGCYCMNLWDVVDSNTCKANRERTFGLGYFDDMSSLERWSKHHQTHLNIYGGFFQYAKKLDNVISLRLFHEVYVLEEGQQFFEYIGCHADTGMLGA